jgi:SNF2 family DNA or RNA helicase
MPRIFDNIDHRLLEALQQTLAVSERADFCVGYFNLRGWRTIDCLMERWQGDENGRCRLLVGMQEKPEDELRSLFSFAGGQEIDQRTIVRLKTRMAQEFRQQLLLGAPSNEDEAGLRRLSQQLRSGKVAVKLFLRHKLHAKLYLFYQPANFITPIVGYMGSSNLTFAGLSGQGELNVDVVDSDACQKLEQWFNDRWQDRWCLDISQELADIIDESWAREEMLLPYYIYLKMAYHLSEEARTGLLEFRIPRDFKDRLFEYQVAAVKIAAHHLNRRGGVLIGDVVGLGKTLMATALARIMQDDYGTETLVLSPKNLTGMWRNSLHDYHLVGEVHSMSNVQNELPDLRRFRVVIIDESHNLRNRDGKRYKAIKDYIEKNESKCILLTATPYNKTYLDLSAQLRLFLSEEQSKDLGIRPERLLSQLGESRFSAEYQCPVRSLTAFEKSPYPDDWRDLMRLYLVRRTRSFIQDNYAQHDPESGRTYLLFPDGRRSYFPARVPRTVTFPISDAQRDPYAMLYSDEVTSAVNALNLPRYGLANYIAAKPKERPTPAEARQLDHLSRAGKRLMGFCRTNLFKRLESGGPAFLQSLERHVLRNYVVLHAIEHGLAIPLGTQDAELLDPGVSDEDENTLLPEAGDEAGDGGDLDALHGLLATSLHSEAEYQQRAAQVYEQYAGQYRRRFTWLRPTLFHTTLKKDLLADARALLAVLAHCGTWDVNRDTKLAALITLLTHEHPDEKILIFTQFADTVTYLTRHLKAKNIAALEGVTGDSDDPTKLAWRFSPVSNDKREQILLSEELRILIATDVLSEGQNLQDAHIVVNYDLPWAIIRLIQRAGRVDRIGQLSDTITCYSFLPADGVERIIRLRERVRERLEANKEVVGTDEAFFEDEVSTQTLLDLYSEKAGMLDGEAESEVDLASQAYSIWKNATDANPRLKGIIERLPNVAFSTRAHQHTALSPDGVLVYMRTPDGNDALAWVNREGALVTQSQLAILRAAECAIDEKPIVRPPEQHDLVKQGVEHLIAEQASSSGGQLGSVSGARRRTYERLKHYADSLSSSLFPPSPELLAAIDDIYRYPLRESAKDTLNRQLRSGIDDDHLAQLLIDLRADDRLCFVQDETESQEPQIICSLGLFESDIGQSGE